MINPKDTLHLLSGKVFRLTVGKRLLFFFCLREFNLGLTQARQILQHQAGSLSSFYSFEIESHSVSQAGLDLTIAEIILEL